MTRRLTFETVWATKIPEVAATATHRDLDGRPNPVTYGTGVFASISSPGRVVALAADTGEITWQRSFEGELLGSLTTWKDALYVQAMGSLYCLDAQTGDVRWHFPSNGSACANAGVGVDTAGNSILVGDRDGALHCLEPSSGMPIWQTPILASKQGLVSFAPLVVEDTAFVAGAGGALAAHETRTGRQLWRQDSVTVPLATRPFLALGGIVVGSLDTIYLLDKRNGSPVREWTFRPRQIERALAANAGIVVLVRRDNAGRTPSIGESVAPEWVRIDAQGEVAFEGRARPWTRSVRYCAETGLMYLSGLSGLDVVNPINGEQLGSFSPPETVSGLAEPDVAPGKLHILGMFGTCMSLRHDLYLPPPSGGAPTQGPPSPLAGSAVVGKCSA